MIGRRRNRTQNIHSCVTNEPLNRMGTYYFLETGSAGVVESVPLAGSV